ncbi:TRPT1, partial [Symbiodinium pilosum]
GVAALKTTLAPTRGEEPAAVPCFSLLYLPSYSSAAEMREALVLAAYGHPTARRH